MVDIGVIGDALSVVQQRVKALQDQQNQLNLTKFQLQQSAPVGYTVDIQTGPFGEIVPSMRFIGGQDPRVGFQQQLARQQQQLQTQGAIEQAKALIPVQTEADVTRATAIGNVEFQNKLREADAEVSRQAYGNALGAINQYQAAATKAQALQGVDREEFLRSARLGLRSAYRLAAAYNPDKIADLDAQFGPLLTPQEQASFGIAAPLPNAEVSGRTTAPNTTPTEGAKRNPAVSGTADTATEKVNPETPLIGVIKDRLAQIPKANLETRRAEAVLAATKYNQTLQAAGLPTVPDGAVAQVVDNLVNEPLSKAEDFIKNKGAEQQVGQVLVQSAATHLLSEDDPESANSLLTYQLVGEGKAQHPVIAIRVTPDALKGNAEQLGRVVDDLRAAAAGAYSDAELPGLVQAAQVAGTDAAVAPMKKFLFDDFKAEQHGDTLVLRVPYLVDYAGENGLEFRALRKGKNLIGARGSATREGLQAYVPKTDPPTLEGLVNIASAYRLFSKDQYSKVRIIAEQNFADPSAAAQLPAVKSKSRTSGIVPGRIPNVYEFSVK